MKLTAILILLLSTESFAAMRCTMQFGAQVCRDDQTGETITCREVFSETVCTNSRTGQVTRCRMVFNEYVCR